MAIQLVSAQPRSTTRLRVVFDTPLAAGAFVSSWFLVESLDAVGATPSIVQVLAVLDAPAVAELVLAPALAPSGAYEVTVAAGVPATDASTLAAESKVRFTLGAPLGEQNKRSGKVDIDRIIHGEDIAWNGSDWVENAEGDLDYVVGPSNTTSAVKRRAESSGLPYDPSYGVDAYQYVDAPHQTVSELRGKIEEQARLDPRVDRAEVTFRAEDPNRLGDADIDVSVWFIGGGQDRFTTSISNAQ